MSASDADLDIVLFGPTSVVGRLVAEHLARYAAEEATPPRIGLAGRDAVALRRVRESLGRKAAGWQIIVADASNAADMERLARSARVVATAVGPYAQHGVDLVRACARTGTHYADITGEVLFMRDSAQANHDVAAASGACIVHAAGFDSVPSDLAARLLAGVAAADGAGTLGTTTGYWRIVRGGVSRGTFASLFGQLDRAIDDPSTRDAIDDPSTRDAIDDPYGFSPDRQAEPEPAGTRRSRQLGARWDGDLPGWVAPFVMAGVNGQVVRRSNALSGWAYGRNFRYREVLDTGRANTAPLKAAAWSVGLPLVAASRAVRPARAVVDRIVGALPEGPSRTTRERGRFRLETRTTTTTGAQYVATIDAQCDPACNGTSLMFGETALALAAAPAGSLPAGVRTPADALGEVLTERLRARGFRLVAGRV